MANASSRWSRRSRMYCVNWYAARAESVYDPVSDSADIVQAER